MYVPEVSEAAERLQCRPNRIYSSTSSRSLPFHTEVLSSLLAWIRQRWLCSAVLYEVLGKADPKKLRNSGVNTDELVWHFVLRNEFALNCYKDKKQQQQKESVTEMMTVIDVEGISVSSVTSEVISFIKRSSDIVDNYYPQRE